MGSSRPNSIFSLPQHSDLTLSSISSLPLSIEAELPSRLCLLISLSLSVMAALARISRKALASYGLSAQHSVLHRGLATEAAKAIRPSEGRVKWDYRGQRKIIPLGQWLPKVAVDAYVAPNVVLAGQVTVYDGASVWAGSVLRGDLNKITVGFCSNVQERCVVHAAWSSPTGYKKKKIRFFDIDLLGFRILCFCCSF